MADLRTHLLPLPPPTFAFLLLSLLSLFSPSPCLANTFTVGGSIGWTVPSQTQTLAFYENWSSNNTFHVGDSLQFNYAKEAHSVLQVTRSNYRYCNVTNPLATHDDGRTVIELAQKASYYFICGFPGHCMAGQKFQLKVTAGKSIEILPPALQPALAPSPAPSRGAIPPAVAAAPPCEYVSFLIFSFSLALTASLIM